MLARRRNAVKKKGSAPNAGSSASPTVGAEASGFAGGLANSRSVDAVVDERVATFAPFTLPFLMNDARLDEAADLAGTAEDVMLIDSTARYRTRITHAVLCLYLHIGNDPPDFPRVEPCAKTECWVDPLVAHVAQYASRRSGGGSESIAEVLEHQYRSVLREDIGVMRVVEANVDVARYALSKSRRLARDGRVLVHYNGHGMPRATELGEVWMFDKGRTHYVPLNILECAELAGSPALYVLDCNSAGSVLQRWRAERLHERRPHDLFICACGAGETLPLSPSLPADMLTSCLTTPLKMALEWYIAYSHHREFLPQVTDEMIRAIPGELHDRKSPRGELHWILSAVTDTIAWCTLSLNQFHALFRQDVATKALFRNTLLADRLMREVGCNPVTYPPLSEEAHLHSAWDLWEFTLENALCQLPRLSDPHYKYQPSAFFDHQLLAFEVWVESGDMTQIPEQLPSVLLALTQILYRVRAFTLLAKYLDSGRTAGKRALLCGILPYISKLTTQAPEVFLIVAVIWMQVIRADHAEGCAELQRYQCERYFTELLTLNEDEISVVPVEYGQNATHAPSSSAAAAGITSPPMQPVADKPEAPPSPIRKIDSSAALKADAYEEPLQPTTRAATASREDARYRPAGSHAAPLATPTKMSSAAASGAAPSPPQVKAPAVYYLMKEIDLARCKSMACYILCQLQLRGVRQCLLCWNKQLLNSAFPCLSSSSAELRSWACLVLARLFLGLRHAKEFASQQCTSRQDLFTRLLLDRSPIVRSSCVTLLASVVGVRVDNLPPQQQLRRLQMEKTLVIKLRDYLFDASMSVREELIFFACQVLYNYRGALTCEEGGVHEYVREVGRQAGPWVLEEAGVQVKSQLNASRPTVNMRFDDTIVFPTTVLNEDDRPPRTPELDPSALTPEARETVRGMLHDAALMLCTLYSNCDGVAVNKALKSLSTGAVPQSQRFASEALRTMSRVASMDSSYYMSEADRARTTWNADMMRQLVLDMKDRKLEPQSMMPAVSDAENFDRLVGPVEGAQILRYYEEAERAGGRATPRGSPTHPSFPSVSRYQRLPSAIPADTVVCTAFRVLEPAMVVATKNQRLSYISYDSYSAQGVVSSFSVRLAGPVHDVLVINDLSEQCGLLIVDKRGGFSLMKNCLERDPAPTEAAVFSACPPPKVNTWIDLKAAYRSNTATLYYGGPIGSASATEIHALSLAEEQVTQRLEVSGNPTLTALEAPTMQQALLAGFSDAVVRYYDDRHTTGHLRAVGVLQCRSSKGAALHEAVVGVGAVAAGAGFTIATATRSTVNLFDSRKLNEPVMARDHDALYQDAVAPHIAAPMITNCSVGCYTGLIALSFSDSTYAAYNTRGVILNDHPLAPAHVMQPLNSAAASPVLPSSCAAHPLRPMMTCGGDLLFL